MTAVLWVAACWLTPSALIVAWVLADRWLDGRWAVEAPETSDADAEWLAVLAATEIDEDADLTYQAMCFERWEAEL